MEKATVTVESEGEKTTVDVIVTDEKDYEIVDLRVEIRKHIQTRQEITVTAH